MALIHASRLFSYFLNRKASLLTRFSALGTGEAPQENITLIGPEALAENVVDLGLTTWVMAKVG